MDNDEIDKQPIGVAVPILPCYWCRFSSKSTHIPFREILDAELISHGVGAVLFLLYTHTGGDGVCPLGKERGAFEVV